ncbi:tRNA (guanine(10)-N(2))-dimethyltransferase [Methanoculleus sp. FWC-SCC1]|uniref:tRNA (guanine(26)-N(2))-dimethyltransferase n=1 Tax=Methanoculleus frigidifontis TaxID=2584085 RepID=A0ABT8M7V0_9EURY|nr:tRNA (guanine(10)-N(2))-dimethyltransferase [Methanoculleus sp. FWC-SCC1]MDN7024006.1 tRNA (guanine(10)-N(2))-dimethyltransferase [Methanoculleus sp. FWC-SCC1]
MDYSEVTEGNTHFFVPRQDPCHTFPPASTPVFYNPRMELNRDATVLLLTHLRPSDYLDAMGASGVRGLRVARECGIPVTINDREPGAVDLIRQNAAALGDVVAVTHQDVNVLMSGRSFDAVDLDPFGSPAPFVDAAVRSARRYLFVTATDTAPLCGAHLKAGMRRYFARPMNTEYHGEVALRILLGFVVREVVKYDRGVEPVFCFAREHYVRLHLRLLRGAAAADRTLARIGYIMQCPGCFERTETAGLLPEPCRCDRCDAAMAPIGPLWLGAINDHATLAALRERAEAMPLGSKVRLTRLLDVLVQELDTSSHYDYHVIAKAEKVSPTGMETVLTRLTALGYRASRTHYAGTGIKTDAPLAVLKSVIR